MKQFDGYINSNNIEIIRINKRIIEIEYYDSVIQNLENCGIRKNLLLS